MCMKILSDSYKCAALSLMTALLISGCSDTVDPAGVAQYVNPEYPSTLIGYAVISTSFSGAFSYDGRVYVLDQEADIVESFSLSDPYLNLNFTPVTKDTLPLGFTPGDYAFAGSTGILYLEDNLSHNVYKIQLPDGSPELLHNSESFITDLFLADGNGSLIICFLGAEWLARKIDVSTGSTLGEYETGWPITRAALSEDTGRLLVSNSSKEFLLEIETATMGLIDTLYLTERPGPFIYNTSGNIVVFNQYSVDPRIFLYEGSTGEMLTEISSINPYQTCNLIPGTDVIIAPRRSDNRVSILNSENMIFAPSIYCLQYCNLAFSTEDGQIIIVLSKNSGRVYVYSHQ